jgi:hypothetical protein
MKAICRNEGYLGIYAVLLSDKYVNSGLLLTAKKFVHRFHGDLPYLWIQSFLYGFYHGETCRGAPLSIAFYIERFNGTLREAAWNWLTIWTRDYKIQGGAGY